MSWESRVALSDEAGGFAYRPNEVIAVGEDALAAVIVDLIDTGVIDPGEDGGDLEAIRREIAESRPEPFDQSAIEVRGLEILVAPPPAAALAASYLVSDVPDVLATVRRLRTVDATVQPNHVFFASPLATDPVYASPVYASPVYASPVYASPVYASPVYASPVYASPVYASGAALPHQATDISRSPAPVHPSLAAPSANQTYRLTGLRLSTARSVRGEHGHLDSVTSPSVEVVVIDTGIAEAGRRPTFPSGTVTGGLVPRPAAVQGAGNLNRPEFGSTDDPLDANGDDFIDPASGHGTFIAGIVERMAPGCAVELDRAFWSEGDGDEWDIVDLIVQRHTDRTLPHLLNLSFSGYILEDEPWELMRSWLTAIMHRPVDPVTVVAAAGNDATSRPNHPAAFPGVIGVGAIGPVGPAPFTNYGPWVTACAPGVDLVSTFFVEDPSNPFEGRLDQHPDDVDELTGWARWSGTSFATPVVVGALARRMQRGATASQAVDDVITNPWMMRIPGLGTVVGEL